MDPETGDGIEFALSEGEVRVLGSLVEKQLATPQYYPLTLNALALACNQKSNREPVMNLLEGQVIRALDGLRRRQLAWEITGAGSRVPKYEHNVSKRWGLSKAETATLGVIMLRGAQTLGEVRAHVGRMYDFRDLEEVEQVLQRLADHAEGPFVVRLPRQPGTKEARYMHRLAGEPAVAAASEAASEEDDPADLTARIASLEGELRRVQQDLAELRTAFEGLRSQLE